MAKSAEDLIAAEEKVGHLNQVKSQLESTHDQLEGGLDKEKKARANLEKMKRKIEGDLKMAQDTVNDLEREKNDIQNIIAAKEKNVHMLSAKLDDEQSLVAKAQKNIKELQARVEGGEEELEAERQARSKAERQRSDLAREIEQLGDRYDQASGATVAQVELNKKREAEIIKLRKDVEEANIAAESVLSNLKRKQGDATLEMQEQIDTLQKMKAKIEKDKQTIMAEISDARAATEEVARSQASADKANKALVEQLNSINKKVDAANLTLGDFATAKNKIANENGELLRIVGDLENSLNMLAKAKAALSAQLNDTKALCDNEARERQLLVGKFRNLEHEVDVAKEALDEEAAGRDNILRLNAKAEGDAAAMRQKYEQDAVQKAEELEMVKMKLTARNTEAEAAIDNLNAKLAQIDKAKSRSSRRSPRCPPTSTRPRLSMPPWRGRPSSSTRPFPNSRSSPPMRRPSSSWRRSGARTRPCPTRSRISWTRSPREAAPSTRLTKSARGLRLRRWSCSPPWRRLRPPWSRRRTRC